MIKSLVIIIKSLNKVYRYPNINCKRYVIRKYLQIRSGGDKTDPWQRRVEIGWHFYFGQMKLASLVEAVLHSL